MAVWNIVAKGDTTMEVVSAFRAMKTNAIKVNIAQPSAMYDCPMVKFMSVIVIGFSDFL